MYLEFIDLAHIDEYFDIFNRKKIDDRDRPTPQFSFDGLAWICEGTDDTYVHVNKVTGKVTREGFDSLIQKFIRENVIHYV